MTYKYFDKFWTFSSEKFYMTNEWVNSKDDYKTEDLVNNYQTS